MTKEEERQAKEYGLVVVFGASDDLVEFRGSIDDELSIYYGGSFRINSNGILPEWNSINHDDINACRGYFLSENFGSKKIIALWNDDDGIIDKLVTDIPHATFEIYDNNEPFCRGIVFSVKELP